MKLVKCLYCSYMKPDIPCAKCRHPSAKSFGVTDKMIFDFCDNTNCPLATNSPIIDVKYKKIYNHNFKKSYNKLIQKIKGAKKCN